MSWTPDSSRASLWYWRRAMIRFVVEWFRSRRYSALAWGSFAFTAGIGMMLISGIAAKRHGPSLVPRYRQAADQARAVGEWEKADLYYRKLIFLGEADESLQFGMALVADQVGDAQRAVRLIRSLAPPDASGYAPAHLWMARYALQVDEEDRRMSAAELKHHLHEATKLERENLEVHLTLAELYQAEGDLEGAIPHLARVARQQPQHRLTLARLHALSGDTPAALREAGESIKALRQWLEEDPGDLTVRLQLAESLIFLEQFADAGEVLLEPTSRDEEGRLQEALGNLYCAAADAAMRERPVRLALVAQRVLRGFHYAPDHEGVVLRLIDLAQRNVALPPEAMAAVRKRLETQLAAQGSDPSPELQMFLGRICAGLGQLEDAREYLLAARERNIAAQVLLARLHRTEGDDEAAQREGERAVERLSEMVQIEGAPTATWLQLADAYAVLGRWDEAERTLTDRFETAQGQGFKMALASLHMQRAESLTDEPPEARLEWLLKAFEVTPGSPLVLQRITQIAREHPQTREPITGAFQATLASGRAANAAHQALGMIALEDKGWRTAQFHLEQAHRGRPDDPVLMGALARSILHLDDGDIDQAMALTQRALELQPQEPELYETRGLAYLRQKQWAEAVTDLERALAAMPKRTSIHQLLSIAYRGIGNTSMADEHRRRMQEAAATGEANAESDAAAATSQDP
jgi:tetratricopeptide (TPR) repeat protein